MPKDRMKKALRELRRVLKEDGVLFVSLKRGNGEVVEKKWGSKVKQYHLRLSEAASLSEDVGYVIIEEEANERNTGSSFMKFYCRIS